MTSSELRSFAGNWAQTIVVLFTIVSAAASLGAYWHNTVRAEVTAEARRAAELAVIKTVSAQHTAEISDLYSNQSSNSDKLDAISTDLAKVSTQLTDLKRELHR